MNVTQFIQIHFASDFPSTETMSRTRSHWLRLKRPNSHQEHINLVTPPQEGASFTPHVTLNRSWASWG